jgi:prepilin-type processing-associated H-X9-DG protein
MRESRAFTLVELAVILGTLALLVTVLSPALARSHNRACSFSFADNHVEMKRWSDPRTTPVQAYTGSVASPGNVDVAWLQDHSTRPK